jgi:hypothetical protein
MAATGGSSLCALSPAAGPVPAIKYHEGRWAALREVSRLNAPDDLDRFDADCIDTAARTREQWAQQLANLHAREAGPDWIAYRSGGVDALDQLIGGGCARDRRAGHLAWHFPMAAEVIPSAGEARAASRAERRRRLGWRRRPETSRKRVRGRKGFIG